ncbi:DUF4244 domain-containing protein [Actinacidiphila bryophytorum]|uniref:DUF4244 domain-containing protein n=1 Tax=Actinacidiphila bryophytorum TaxID=1436133 RepID=UPI002176996E|nr:DUF4244 domain-containing protein [Actinacidiphila bryophytorum]UWE13164.1 DUF4244 domain-containing protein [Actinacidiphila bryophytorum]
MSIIKTGPAAGKTARRPLDVTGRGTSARRGRAWWDRRAHACRAAAEAGMSTAEYAVGTIAACGFAAVLYKIVTSGPVKSALSGVIEKALHVSF